MPFVGIEHREKPDPLVAGDRCYLHYQRMIRAWRQTPRWTTIDTLARGLFPDDEKRAEFLAFLVLFIFHGVPYEEEKLEENGEVV